MQYTNYCSDELGLTDMNEITKEDIHSFISHLYDLNLASSSISRKISAIKEFHKFLYINDFIKENFVGYIKMPKITKKVPLVLSTSEIDKLLASFDETDDLEYLHKTMIELMYSTGIRVSELIGLKIDDLHLTMNFLQCRGKGSKERIVPMGERAVAMLNHYITSIRPTFNHYYDGQTLFIQGNGHSISRQYVWQMMKNQLKIAGLNESYSPHVLRHTFATHMLENNADIRYIQELLGHTDLSTTQTYTHVTSKALIETIHKFHPRSKKGRE